MGPQYQEHPNMKTTTSIRTGSLLEKSCVTLISYTCNPLFITPVSSFASNLLFFQSKLNISWFGKDEVWDVFHYSDDEENLLTHYAVLEICRTVPLSQETSLDPPELDDEAQPFEVDGFSEELRLLDLAHLDFSMVLHLHASTQSSGEVIQPSTCKN